MGAKFANLHILGGNESELKELFSSSVVGCFSEKFVSVYDIRFEQGTVEMEGRNLSKKITQPVLTAWLWDSDIVSFSIFLAGKQVARHMYNPDGFCKHGNVALFCETLGVSKEDKTRLNQVWKKGDAEAQFDLTAQLLGAPLSFDTDILPIQKYKRNVALVDQWIEDRPKPPKIKSETEAVIVKEEVMDELPFPSDGWNRMKLPDGGFLQLIHHEISLQDFPQKAEYTIKCFNENETCRWELTENISTQIYGFTDEEIWLSGVNHDKVILKKIDAGSGKMLMEMEHPFGTNSWNKLYDSGVWWIAHNGIFRKNKNFINNGHMLSKFDKNMSLIKQISLPTNTQDLFLSPDKTKIYVFFYEKEIMVIDTETLEIENIYKEKGLLIPKGFDASGRFWIQRGATGVEAWNAALTKTLSRHKLKGDVYIDTFLDDDGNLCVKTFSEKERLCRTYQLRDKL